MSILELLKGDGKSGFGYDSTTTTLMIALSRRISASSCSEHQLYFLWRRVVGENAEAFDFLDAFEHDGVVQRLNRWPA